jgi:tRNA(Ile)-lysidine synthase
MKKTIESLLKPYKTVILAYSGGVDSQVLLYLLSKVPHIKVVALHVNHNISDQSNCWEEFCKKNAYWLSIDYKSKSVNLDGPGNLENKARKERYTFFTEEYKQYDPKTTVLLTAHHMNDQAENFLLRLMRGSGLEGLSSIKPHSVQYGMNIVRPLLNFKKTQLIEYAKDNNLDWVEDPSNKDDSYDRNYIRNKVIPLFEDKWPHAVSSIGKSVSNLNENNQFVTTFFQDKVNNCVSGEGLNTQILKSFSHFEKKQIVREWLKKEIGMSPDGNLVESVIQQCVNAPAHNAGKIIKKFFTIKKENNVITIIKS